MQKHSKLINARKKCEYFEGLYLKHQNKTQTVALIPSLHINNADEASGSLQIITESDSWQKKYDSINMNLAQNTFEITLGQNCFTERGCRLHIQEHGLTLDGHLKYGPLTPPKHSIMGPFRYFPCSECQHIIFSMLHTVNGELQLNGKKYIFQSGTGYIEGDKGRSFPSKYLWTQFNSYKTSIVMAAATIPIRKTTINGCFASILYKGKEIRLATYFGAKIICADNRTLIIQQKDIILSAELLKSHSHPLLAPKDGRMERWIYENAACKVRYQLWKKGEKIFEIIKENAGFEGEWTHS